MKVRDLMITDVIYAKKDDTVRELLKKLVKHKIGGVPVLDNEHKLLGMVSDGDVVRAVANNKQQTTFDFYSMIIRLEKTELKTSVKQKMDWPVDKMMTRRKIYYVNPDDNFEEVLNILSKHHFKKIPVINQAGRVVGVISRGDVIRFISQQIIED
ncbi:CBS domain-containing protein [Scopulibacillus daqui]|uniref:CBS domain-containing protein n=1 Tax=Scopulibacillus daqui TaxID=1469162 RepID=A0ABS2Q0D1_9BACL|nr:CBS domain-containing protein [Scopulibacillus daqui]MBM7645752.1 CBS domain-containing protein [Scopulibacillus daqui]